MSFIAENVTTKPFNAGYFLASAECTRETREADVDLATTESNGTKYVKAGTIYPSNDSNAIGIIYEDTDVSTGNMPCSVVTKGIVYEDRIPVQGASYDAVTPAGTENPEEEGWYEKSGDDYVLTEDTTVDNEKDYYEKSDVRISSDAKTALIAKGFVFETAPEITRP